MNAKRDVIHHAKPNEVMKVMVVKFESKQVVILMICGCLFLRLAFSQFSSGFTVFD